MAKAATKAQPTGPEILYCEQGSQEWALARAGLPTASVFSTVMANGKDGGASITRTKLLHRLAGELITGEPAADGYRNAAMERGNLMEAEARDAYARLKDVEVHQVGLVTNFSGLKRCAASPDGLVGFDSVLEIKTAIPEVLIPLLLKGAGMPPEHRAQTQGALLVTERDFVDLFVYWPKMPPYVVRVFRDEVYLKDLHNQIQVFNYELADLVKKLRSMGIT